MHPLLRADLDALRALLDQTADAAFDHLTRLDTSPPAVPRPRPPFAPLPETGMGGGAALAQFVSRYGDHMTAHAGARYWGFVTGGTTPAALLGDWLTSAYDVNAADGDNSAAPHIEQETIALLRALFGLPDTFAGVFVSGATMSNFTGLATGREWVSQQRGYSAARDGMAGRAAIRVLSATPHSSTLKALAMLGMGRDCVVRVARLAGEREAMDTHDLARQLDALDGEACIVVASAGTVNTVDFDDLHAIAALRERYPFWLHIDAAFGGFAAASPRYAHLTDGMDAADSLTIDAHKWLNVPYDSAMLFTRHRALQAAVFQNSAAYLPTLGDDPDPLHLTPENSRRLRALPAWLTLHAYGREGVRDVVERNCAVALALGERIAASSTFTLLAPVRMNVVCFTFADTARQTSDQVGAFLRALRADGRLFLTPTVYDGVAGMRAAVCNWRTTPDDLHVAWAALEAVSDTP